MNQLNDFSRSTKSSKRRNLNGIIIGLIILAVTLFIVLIILILKPNESKKVVIDEVEEVDMEKEEVQLDEDDELEVEQTEDPDLFIDYVDPSDENVLEAYIGNWKPIGTEQEGQHITDLADGSKDRAEIKQAVSEVTHIAEDELVEWNVEHEEPTVIATVSDKKEKEIFRVYLSWVDEDGWQVTKVEQLKENDQK